MKVSVIIPAYNAAETIGETLQSLQQQIFTQWEAVVIDDGSTDVTVEVVQSFINKDRRIRIFSQENQGLSGARNSGVAVAKYDWLLFLDADDWIFPDHLERLTDALKKNCSLDIVYCGWTYALPDGEFVFPQFPSLQGDLFVPFTQYCVSVVHTFVVRRSLVRSLGPFNTTMRSCEDWGLWQRIARTGARFGVVNEILAAYRTRPNSLSRNGHQLLQDGTRVLIQGHSPDVCVQPSHPVYPDGLPVKYLTKNKFDLLCACAGYLIGGGKDARSLLEMLEGETCTELKPEEVAQCVLIHALVSASRPRQEWRNVWQNCQSLFLEFLIALEAHSGTQNLARHSYRIAQKLLSQYIHAPSLGRIGNFIIPKNWNSRKTITYSLYNMKNLVKRSIWTAPLILPTLRSPMHQIRQTLMAQGYIQPEAHASHNPQEYFEKLFIENPDPWSYTNRYEQIKYEQTLALIPDIPIENALELACAEGHFTTQFAPRVKRLLATDISSTALDRCQQRCANAGVENVRFQRLDFLTEKITERFDLITCSEVLYFAGDRQKLTLVVENIANALNADGYLIMTHSNVLVDDPTADGFDWDHAFGAKFIGETFARSPRLKFVREFQTPLYRIQLFQKCARRELLTRLTPKVEYIEKIDYQYLPAHIAQDIIFSRSKPLPILAYDRITDFKTANSDTQPTPEVFENQLRYLHESGYRTVSLSDWGYSTIANRSNIHQEIAIVFRNADSSFLSYGLPLLKKYGFSATVFLYAEEVGKSNAIDPVSGETISLIEWQQIRQLQAEGVMFASHGLNRQDLTTLSLPDAWQHIKRSQQILQQELAVPICTFAYPQGKSNLLLQYLVGLAGFDFALGGDYALCTQHSSLLNLPQIQVKDLDSLEELNLKLKSLSTN